MEEQHEVKISVACCTFNGERYVRQQLESIVGQTRRPDEIVICDDGSQDATGKFIEEFAQTSLVPVRRQINPSRLGVTKNFEKAISLATGEIIFLSDQDDIWHAEKLAQMLKSLREAAMVFSNGQVVNEDHQPAGYTLWDSMWFDRTEQERMRSGDALPILLRHAVAAGATMAFSAAFRSLILPIPDLPHCHDIWIALLLACAAQIYPLDENLIDYRLHGANEVGLKKHGLMSQIRMARWQLRFGAFQYAADLHQAAMDRLREHGLLSSDIEILLKEKIEHSRVRHEMPSSFLARLPIIFREMPTGRYQKYSYGYKSVLQDLFLR
ncbi:MAG TPA: glycosyltransferase family 2 protein [Tepidisphaeraceae bacterium]|jgi:glycosyltransferase involved in cell wall biosynthesis